MPRWLVVWMLALSAPDSSHAQQTRITVDTTTEQYRAESARVDSLAVGAFAQWLARWQFPNWTVQMRVDTLTDGFVGETVANEMYRNATVTLDTRKLAQSDTDEVMCHETLHIKLTPYTELARSLSGEHEIVLRELSHREEALVSDICRGILWRRR